MGLVNIAEWNILRGDAPMGSPEFAEKMLRLKGINYDDKLEEITGLNFFFTPAEESGLKLDHFRAEPSYYGNGKKDLFAGAAKLDKYGIKHHIAEKNGVRFPYVKYEDIAAVFPQPQDIQIPDSQALILLGQLRTILKRDDLSIIRSRIESHIIGDTGYARDGYKFVIRDKDGKEIFSIFKAFAARYNRYAVTDDKENEIWFSNDSKFAPLLEDIYKLADAIHEQLKKNENELFDKQNATEGKYDFKRHKQKLKELTGTDFEFRSPGQTGLKVAHFRAPNTKALDEKSQALEKLGIKSGLMQKDGVYYKTILYEDMEKAFPRQLQQPLVLINDRD